MALPPSRHYCYYYYCCCCCCCCCYPCCSSCPGPAAAGARCSAQPEQPACSKGALSGQPGAHWQAASGDVHRTLRAPAGARFQWLAQASAEVGGSVARAPLPRGRPQAAFAAAPGPAALTPGGVANPSAASLCGRRGGPRPGPGPAHSPMRAPGQPFWACYWKLAPSTSRPLGRFHIARSMRDYSRPTADP